jgi:hypothetical protein
LRFQAVPSSQKVCEAVRHEDGGGGYFEGREDGRWQSWWSEQLLARHGLQSGTEGRDCFTYSCRDRVFVCLSHHRAIPFLDPARPLVVANLPGVGQAGGRRLRANQPVAISRDLFPFRVVWRPSCSVGRSVFARSGLLLVLRHTDSQQACAQLLRRVMSGCQWS